MSRHAAATKSNRSSAENASHASDGDRGLAIAPLKQNRTGLPDGLRAGIESLSGFALSDVRVHANSARPAQLQALAFVQGTEIHIAPGQERHLPHEAWHVVQQKQGRVRATIQAKGISINDDRGLEREADVMGRRASELRSANVEAPSAGDHGVAISPPVIQCHIPSAAFVDLMGRLRKQKKDGKVSDERLFRWNALGKFDGPFEAKDVPGVLARMSEWNDISTSAGGGPLSPGQTHESETLPAYLDHFNAFTYDLPDKSWGTLRFEKRFDRMTEHGWISTNEVLPPDVLKSKKEIVVHMIIAVSEGGDALNCNPHVTVRLKDIQDQVTIISMLNDQKAKTLEMKSLGTAAADASMSIGMSSDRLKEKSGAPEKLGIDPATLQKAFPLEWISGVVQAAKAAQPDKAMKLQLK